MGGIAIKLHKEGQDKVMIIISMSSFDRNATFVVKKYSKLHNCMASLLGAGLV